MIWKVRIVAAILVVTGAGCALDPAELGADADTFVEALRKEGLPVGAHYIGVCVYEYGVFTQHRAYARGNHPFCRYDYGPAGTKPVLTSSAPLTRGSFHRYEDYGRLRFEQGQP